jgi:hypothetical protein
MHKYFFARFFQMRKYFFARFFQMRKAGAIPLAVTNVSELCMWMESSNK